MSQPALNELIGLLKRGKPAAIAQLSEQFPAFADELTQGIALGKSEDKAFSETRARLAIQLCRGVIEVVSARIEELVAKARGLRRRKLILASLAALSGAGTLAALGFDAGLATKIGAAITSLVSIGNAIDGFLSKGPEKGIETSIQDLSEAKYSLTVLTEEIQAALDTGLDLAKLDRLVNKANSAAEKLNGKAQRLGI
jgi:Mor family transcriptional regulator